MDRIYNLMSGEIRCVDTEAIRNSHIFVQVVRYEGSWKREFFKYVQGKKWTLSRIWEKGTQEWLELEI